MNEFLYELGTALKGNLSDSEFESNISYYRQYFNEEMAKGKTEKEVCDSLGNPRLIAKNIIDNSPSAKYTSAGWKDKSNYQEYSENASNTYRGTYEDAESNGNVYENIGLWSRIKSGSKRLITKMFTTQAGRTAVGVISTILTILIVVGVIWIIGRVLYFLLPVIAIIMCVRIIVFLISRK